MSGAPHAKGWGKGELAQELRDFLKNVRSQLAKAVEVGFSVSFEDCISYRNS